MSPKIWVLMAFCAIQLDCGSSKAVKCESIGKWYSALKYNINVTSLYPCYLNTKNLNFNENPTRINGQHESGRSDADVGILYIGSGNLLRNFSPIFCEMFPNLEVIFTSYAQIESVDDDALDRCLNLKYLEITGNKFSELPEEWLNRNTKLELIWIQNSQLKSLPEKFFINQKELLYLDIHKNQLDFLPSRIFDSLVKLQRLDIYSNKLQSIDPKWFTNLQYLKELNLSKNEITEVPADVFSALRNLKKLRLSDNKLTTIHSDSFGSMNKLTALWLNNNKINSVDAKFIDSQTFEFFDIENNICGDFWTFNNAIIKHYLQKCFKNYKPRPPPSIIGSSCGKALKAQGTIYGGSQAARGAFPWLAVMVTHKQEFLCGASVVSNRKVVTAAHCLRNKEETATRRADQFLVLVGQYDLNQTIEAGRVPHAVQSVHVHPEWNSLILAYDADIAVLVLDIPIAFNKYIQPICLIQPGSSISLISNGQVVGYGRSVDDSKEHEKIPKVLDMPIHDNEGCFLTNNDLTPFSSRRTFCGGSGDGTGICFGDSGGPLMVLYNGAYYLRGIVSASLLKDHFNCDLNTYSIFTDVPKFYDWINGIGINPNLYSRK